VKNQFLSFLVFFIVSRQDGAVRSIAAVRVAQAGVRLPTPDAARVRHAALVPGQGCVLQFNPEIKPYNLIREI
jgi:hypothetical protein